MALGTPDQRTAVQQSGTARRSPPVGGGRSGAGQGMSIAEIEAWLTTATGRAKQIVASALAEGNEDQARQIIAALEESKRTGRGARRGRQQAGSGGWGGPSGPPAKPQPKPTPGWGGGRQSPSTKLAARAASRRSATTRPMVQKGGLYRGKPHAYIAGGKVTDTSKVTRRKR